MIHNTQINIHIGIPLYLIATIIVSVMGAIAFRMAGGLLSQWVGRDLGNFFPRQIWGAVCAVPVLMAAIHHSGSELRAVLLCPVCGLLVGLMRGAGWGNSLSLGFSSIGKPTAATDRLEWVMTSRIMMMTAPAFAVAFVAKNSLSPQDAIYCFASWFVAAFLSMHSYKLAWQGFALPWRFLGCLRSDPPPTGELGTGFITCFILMLYLF